MVPDVPFDPWRPHLYTPDELYDGLADGYEATADARIYAWSQAVPRHGPLKNVLAKSLHDSSIDDALEEFTRGRRIVGLMGGHALTRDHPTYTAAARLAHGLAASGLTVATGGGPGAMEAANLGARLGEQPAATLDRTLTAIASVPSFAPDVDAWAGTAIDSVRDLDDSGCSLGIPTWHYGHEPPNAFSSVVAKYFRNAIREDVLLEVCRGGIVFLPGAAGTVQEVFQAACANYYADESDVAPMLFVGRAVLDGDCARLAARQRSRRRATPRNRGPSPRRHGGGAQAAHPGVAPGARAQRGLRNPARRGTISLWPAPRNVCATSRGYDESATGSTASTRSRWTSRHSPGARTCRRATSAASSGWRTASRRTAT